MADHSKPIVSDAYADVLSQIRGRFEDQAKLFDPATTSPTNLVTGTVAWQSSSSKFVKWNGTAWVDLITDLSLSGSLTLSGGTANSVPYLNASKVVTTGPALTFDGANFWIGNGATTHLMYINGSAVNGGAIVGQRNGANSWFIGETASALGSGTGLTNYVYGDNPVIWHINSAEQMRLTSTGLGIGASSPTSRLVVQQAQNTGDGIRLLASGSDSTLLTRYLSSIDAWQIAASYGTTGAYKPITWFTGGLERVRLDISGNLGLGVTPSAWEDDKALQLPQGSISSGYEYGISITAGSHRAASNTWKYTQGAAAVTRYNQANGAHQWFTASSGTTGNVISFNLAMTLDASRNLLVGTTTASSSVTNGFTVTGASGITALGIGHITGSGSGTNYIVFNYNGASIGSITQSGTTGVDFSGNAATVTNGVYTTGSYANPSWITSLDYSKLSGTVPTWNQNTTGNAATVTNGVYTTGNQTIGGDKTFNGAVHLGTTTIQSIRIGQRAGTSLYYGRWALEYNGSGLNTAIGDESLSDVDSSGGANSCFGARSGKLLTTASANTIIGGFDGNSGGLDIRTSSNNVVLADGSGNIAARWVNGGGWFQKNNSASWSTTSDASLKENVFTLSNGLDIIMSLRPVGFNYKISKQHTVGFIAQEYENVLPEQVIEDKSISEEIKTLVGKDSIKVIEQNLIPYLVSAIQVLKSEFEAYKASHP
jgi:hypothetical protein